MSAARDQYLELLGITRWTLRDKPQRAAVLPVPEPEPALSPSLPSSPTPAPPLSNAGNPDWAVLQAEVAACTACTLHETRTQTVFGVGNRNAEWMIVGEAPGFEEDRQGEPFVGRAGQLLDSMLRAAGFAREDVFIANILKCRPPDNRDPRPEEAAACNGFLQKQIEWVAPKLVLCVGRIAAQNLLGTTESTAKLRGKVHTHPATGTPVIVTYHPAYLLRKPSEKRKAWEDLKLAMRVARREPA
ncbi:MAG TPA: uracil-DNA glycosylase family protein [Gammaproteobacteria bacterium]